MKKKRTPKEVVEARKKARRRWAVGAGAWLATYGGVIAQAALKQVDPKTLTLVASFDGWTIGSFALGAVIASYIAYRRAEKGELDRKAAYASQVLWGAFCAGFTLSGLADLLQFVGGIL